MKKEKQLRLIEALEDSGYYIGIDSDLYHSGSIDTVKVIGTPVKGYTQYRIYPGRGKGRSVLVYKHDLVWIITNGPYSENKRVVFIDGNKNNCSVINLKLVDRRQEGIAPEGIRKIRNNQIYDIKFYLKAGITSPSKIARELNLNRSSVARTIKKLTSGLTLKYETSDYIPNTNNFINKALNKPE